MSSTRVGIAPAGSLPPNPKRDGPADFRVGVVAQLDQGILGPVAFEVR